ncbi:BspA family leucine-rich repeat surface protein [Roseivirga sp.]|uniref:BspA family leucine-rich repeat surface protein n=1 Tax=Roseivirga sp. TaxID=1964215 RepID=UPI003B8C77F5
MMKQLSILIMALAINVTLAAQKPFITTWKTDNPGISRDNQIVIPTIGFGYYYEVDWGDGTKEKAVTGDAFHTYDKPGTYQVSITGEFPSIYFNSAGDSQKILSVDQWGDINWKSMTRAFKGCNFLHVWAKDAPKLKNTKDLSSMFESAILFNESIDHWSLETVEDLSYMFKDAISFNQKINSWNVSNVTDMSGLFWNATAFNQSLAKWQVSNVRNMAYMFWRATSFNQPINDWNVERVNSMGAMFEGAYNFNQDISNWNVSNVNILTGMFMGASSFNQDVAHWRVDNALDISNMFSYSGLSYENYELLVLNWKRRPAFRNKLNLESLTVSLVKQ